MLPSWRPRISFALGLYLRRFSSSTSARSLKRACASDCSFARRASLWRFVPLMMLRKNFVLGFSLFEGLWGVVSEERSGSGQ